MGFDHVRRFVTCDQRVKIVKNFPILTKVIGSLRFPQGPTPLTMPTSAETRYYPNILITGTPGVGKSCLAELLIDALSYVQLNYNVVNIGELIKTFDSSTMGERDEEFDTVVLSDEGEDKLLDHLEDKLSYGVEESSKAGFIVDYHSCSLFPERWFDLVLVLRANTDVLFDRLVERGYSELKRTENLQVSERAE